ncbi:hypothetical protein SLEP1_g29608 [Rubroshorea leprosula]|uniref:Reverse transcriptase domain-containing protein n=1 Tax=Rubroshorea leprosula TaxID=152421 RepID=A0AAV5K8T4_9ROSI|nr:hypothetical protein SLEP1_g29608 [Rubroshorea leprosula]
MASNPARRDQTRFCAFHGEHGHDTEECRQLKIEIERLIRRGALRQFVKTNDSSRNRKDQHKKPGEKEKEEEQPLEVVGTINIVSLPSEVRSKEKTPSVTLEAKNSLRKSEVISFTEKDLQQREVYPHEPLMIQVIVEDRNLRQGKILKRILVDTGSCRDILTHEVFKKLGFSTQFMRPCEFPLVGLFGKEVPVVGIITIPIHVGDTAQKAVVTLDFFVVDIPCSFNAILGRPGLNALQAVISTSHMMIKFPTPKGIGVARGRSAEIQETVTAQVSEQSETRKLRPKSRAWDLIATGDIGRRRALTVDTMDAREGINEQRAEPIDRTKSVVLTSKNPNKTTNVGADMDPKFTAKLEECLRRHEDIFAGSAADMPGIDPKVACHRLGVPPEAVPVRQKMRQFGAERTAAIKEEVEKLKKAGFIKEINFCEWLSNVVMVKKANGKWRMCIDFTDLNKVCPKDNYALPNIDELVDNSSGYEVLSFCDAYSGYNQIPLAEEDQDKTAFIAAGETYCYIVMPFGLKNAGATYQRFANKIFVLLKGKCVEVYVDDLIIKSRSLDQHLKDLEQVFSILQEYGMKLNPLKCTFGVKAGKFLGFMLTNRGIEANLEKVRVIIEMRPLASIREVQHLMGKIVALVRFLSKSAERCLPIFKILRGKKNFEWTQDCQKAFEQLKTYLASPPLISKPSPGETLFLYIAATTEAVSAALIRQEQKKAKTCVLRKQSTARTRKKVRTFGETSICSNHSSQKTEILLYGAQNYSPHQLSFETCIAQTRLSRKAGKMEH